jgi:polyisoprenoid-binding protein YceI
MIAMPREGTHTLGPDSGEILLHTGREGMAARMGHDLTLEVIRWTATVVVDGMAVERSSATATIDARSLQVKEATGGAMPLSDGDRADIEKNIAEKVLQTDRHPEITFTSTAVEVVGEDAVTVTGDLSMAGRSRPVRIPLSVQPADGDVRLTGRVPLAQSEWGIRPFRAMMGSLKVRDQIDVSVDVRLPAG